MLEMRASHCTSTVHYINVYCSNYILLLQHSRLVPTRLSFVYVLTVAAALDDSCSLSCNYFLYVHVLLLQTGD